MAESDPNDPFNWDEDRLLQEFCTPNRTWTPPPGLKFPEPNALRTKLIECAIDGNSLLTCTEEYNYKELWENLGIKKLPHQVFLKKVIRVLQNASPAYQQHRLQLGLVTKSDDDRPEDGSPAVKSELCTHSDVAGSSSSLGQSALAPAALSSAPQPPVISQGVISPALSSAALPDQPVVQSVEQPGIEQSPQAFRESCTAPPTHQSTEPESPIQESPSKKRRIAPITISEGPVHVVPLFAPTEGDRFLEGTVEGILESDDTSGFLGSATLFPDKILEPAPATFADQIERQISQGPRSLPPGRRLQVWKAMKKYLLVDRLAIDMVEEEDDDESVLPLLDSDEEFDEETKREMERDRLEDEAVKERMEANRKHLTKEEINQVLNDVIRELEARWHAEKKPKYELKANKLWRDARRSPYREAYLQSLKTRQTELNGRLSKIVEEFTVSDWSRAESLSKRAPDALELTVFDRLYQHWLINVLENPREPPKPEALPRLARQAKRKRDLGDDEEILSSGSEDDLDAFIDDSAVEVDEPVSNDAMDIDIPAPGDETDIKIENEKNLALATSQNLSQNSQDSDIEELPANPFKEYERLDEADLPGFDTKEDLDRIVEIGLDYWAWAKDADRLVVAALNEWIRAKRYKVLQAVNSRETHDEVWEEYIEPVLEQIKIRQDNTPPTISSAHRLGQMFDVYTRVSMHRQDVKLTWITWTKLKRFRNTHFPRFVDLLRRVSPLFEDTTPPPSALQTPRKPNLPRIKLVNTPSKEPGSQNGESSQLAVLETDVADGPPTVEGVKMAPESQDPADVDGFSDDGSVNGDQETPFKKRRRRKPVNEEARRMRIATLEQSKEFDRRREMLKQNLATGIVPSDKTRLIVNETKEEDQPLIFINDHIGSRIKDHQIDGVRFMWNHVVVNFSAQQGCLLAHTMGLGKTMQVITLLVVIAEASASDDPLIREQIPEKLRTSKTMILCPAGLVDNWTDELYMWAPENALGDLWVVNSTYSEQQRETTVKNWVSKGGILIIGYPMFTTMGQKSEEMEKLLKETPNLVVADEAHYMKNQDSQRAQATANFSTPSRIALTGSPLTNNVSDYYAMINWVAPNYLGPSREFNANFAAPIKEGLYADSIPPAKRRARKLLHVLKETVGPKMHRKDADVLHNALPAKKEFIITLPLTDLQRRLYEEYIHCVNDTRVSGSMTSESQAKVWSMVAKLGLVLAHPKIFKMVAEAKKTGPDRKGAGKSEDEFDIPQDLLSGLLKQVADRDIDNPVHSYKILALLKILAACKEKGDKVLIFSQSIPTLNYLESLFRLQKLGYLRLDGKTPIAARQGATKKFNNTKGIDIYLISTKAGGVGLNIFGANRVVIFDFKYTPADEQQAIGRAYRLGQTKPVYVYWLFVGGTFEEIIHNSGVFKTQLASRVVDKKNPTPWATRVKEYFAPPRDLEREDLTRAFCQDDVLDALLKSQDVGKEICKITSTETFEREENFELTTDEQRDAEQEIKMFQLRSQDPEEYQRQMAARRKFDQAMAPPSMYMHQATQAALALPSVIQSTAAGLTVNSAIQQTPAAPTVHSASQPNPTGVPSPQATSMLPGLRPHAISLPSPTQSAGGPALTNQVIQPIMGAGTFLRKAPSQATSSSLATPNPPLASFTPIAASCPLAASAPPPVPIALRSPSAPLQSTPSPSGTLLHVQAGYEHLLTTFERLRSQGYKVPKKPEEVANVIVNHAMRSHPGGLPLPVRDQLRHFNRLAMNHRFSEALLAGFINPQAIIDLNREELGRVSELLDNYPEAEYREMVWKIEPQPPFGDISNLNLGTGSGVVVKAEKKARKSGGSTTESGQGRRVSSGSRRGGQSATVRRPPPLLRAGDSAESPMVIDDD
ncbi:hypothetical protein QBC38DRAFT_186112 [Podospora fimiseda]|uniref:Uncharacterized protein n=1 Tax=Podospora fimiseda TaxID=252190 RepID=A0AAN7H323_9PEZI|nr:hypothetical protein QBC38DRAFT_186112 [Podospora fimiseda]